MAIFGDLGKALGLGSAKELLPTIGAAAGFYFGGPMGAPIVGNSSFALPKPNAFPRSPNIAILCHNLYSA